MNENPRFEEYRLEKESKPTRRYGYFVTGKGQFPFDMLRYDCAWPADQTAAYRMGVDFFHNQDEYMQIRSVKLTGYAQPTVARWASFGWSVGMEDLSKK